MLRKISATTLGQILAAYFEQFPEEARPEIVDLNPSDGAELLLLLPRPAAWRVLQSIGAPAAAPWLHGSTEAAFERLIQPEHLEQLAKLWPEAAEELKERILARLNAEYARQLQESIEG
jgi:DNA-directed RNA polymerase subunit F